jgi:hypothetical protein
MWDALNAEFGADNVTRMDGVGVYDTTARVNVGCGVNVEFAGVGTWNVSVPWGTRYTCNGGTAHVVALVRHVIDTHPAN